jgi:hypothetical protein
MLYRRLRRGVLSLVVGWAVAVAATIPFLWPDLVRDAPQHAAGARLFFFAEGLLLWAGLSGAVCVGLGLIGMVPAVYLFSDVALYRQRYRVAICGVLFCWSAMAIQLHVWTAFDHDGVGLFYFWRYLVFFAIFVITTVAVFFRQAKLEPNR